MIAFDLVCDSGTSSIIIGGKIDDALSYHGIDESIIITDRNVDTIYGKLFKEHKKIVIEPGEHNKSLDTVNVIYNQLSEFGADRNTFIIAIGGGVVSDIAGYSAKTYLRGLRFGIVPTTLLSMVDASIGGKNGVNFNSFKNQIGTIKQPEFIISDYSLLATLAMSEIKNGMAEIIKTALVADRELYDLISLEKNKLLEILSHPQGLVNSNKNSSIFQEIIYRTAKAKAGIVDEDETEQHKRKVLNFGHTYGHAIETIYGLSHGESVSLGMCLALEMSVRRELLDKQTANDIVTLLEFFSLPTEADFAISKLKDAVFKDKKRTKDKVQFVMLQEIGQALIKELDFQTL